MINPGFNNDFSLPFLFHKWMPPNSGEQETFSSPFQVFLSSPTLPRVQIRCVQIYAYICYSVDICVIYYVGKFNHSRDAENNREARELAWEADILGRERAL